MARTAYRLGVAKSKGLSQADLVFTLPAADIVGRSKRRNPVRKRARAAWLAEADEGLTPWSGYEGFVVRTVLLRAAEYRAKDAPTVRCSADAAKLCDWLRNTDQEHVCVICLGSASNVLALHDATAGTMHASLLEPSQVARVALLVGSSDVVLVHNHPSGSREPSKQDLELTVRLVDRLKCFGIALVDHLIITGAKGHVSFLDLGLMQS